MKMNELKQIAVFSYWVLRLKPVQRICGGPVNINEVLVMNWLFKAINLYRIKVNRTRTVFTDKLKNDLLYTVTYRDLSYDNMTMLIEGLAV